ncbi:MAG: hypothetical protein EOR47_12935 [Mesorhizobium sp.]|uniref:hypothetical protein n=1 Tax=Mesorhizobium sp. TaxID=1871066 RepID=UPI000FEA1035|nr:hypothetical protein [Mesorhizobium sp.]RWK49824.1 MAG: hypothetical protein EOR47_12935 [Mesorhizobium sp.]
MSSDTGSVVAPAWLGCVPATGSRASSMRSAATRPALKFFDRSASGDQSTATFRATSQAPWRSSSTTWSTVSAPDQMPSMPLTVTFRSSLDATVEMMPARLARPRSVLVSTTSAPTTAATRTSSV